MNVRHVAIDGSTVTYDGALDLSLPPVSVLDFAVGGWTYEFTAGAKTLGRWAAEEVSGIKLTESYGVAGERLLVGHSTAVGADGAVSPVLAGVWEGSASSIVVVNPKSGESRDIINLFASFDIKEVGPNEAIMSPRRGVPGAIDREPTMAKRVAGFGLIETFPATSQTIQMTPRWRGTKVRGGELFRGDSNGVPYYLLAGRSAIAVVMPQSGVAADTVAAGLEQLSIDWSVAGRE
jgi:hypothetical protein